MRKRSVFLMADNSWLAKLCVEKGFVRTTQEAAMALLLLTGAFVNFSALIYFSGQQWSANIQTAAVVLAS